MVIDTYNYGHFLGQAIDSVLEQTLPEDQREVIVVDDGSTDNTQALVSSYGEQIHYIRKSNGGQASAFNVGVSEARGRIVCFLDADDIYYPDKLSRVVHFLAKDMSVGVVYNRYDIIDEKNRIVARAVPPKLYAGNIEGRILLGYVTGSPSSGISARREVLERVYIPEEPFRISADYFYLNILPLVARVGVIEDSLHAYRRHSSNAYLAKTSAMQQAIHANQHRAIWMYAAERLHKQYVRGVHSYAWPDGPNSISGRVRAYASDLDRILSADVSIGLRLWTAGKITSHLLLPPSLYRRLKAIRNHSQV